MLGEKKKALNLILGPEKKEEVKEASPSDLRMAMESFLSCVANHDVEGCMSSLKACILACDSEGYESEEG